MQCFSHNSVLRQLTYQMSQWVKSSIVRFEKNVKLYIHIVYYKNIQNIDHKSQCQFVCWPLHLDGWPATYSVNSMTAFVASDAFSILLKDYMDSFGIARMIHNKKHCQCGNKNAELLYKRLFSWCVNRINLNVEGSNLSLEYPYQRK